jgi:hypothetical protein
VAAARGFVVGMVGQESDLGETARLLVSEAATNAVLHSASGEAGGSFEVRCRLARERLRVEIHDGGAPSHPGAASTSSTPSPVVAWSWSTPCPAAGAGAATPGVGCSGSSWRRAEQLACRAGDTVASIPNNR